MDYPVSINFPNLIPCLGSLSLEEPNLTYCDPLSSENTFFKPSSNVWVKAKRSSEVLNFESFNFSSCGSTGGVMGKWWVDRPLTISLALAVTNSPPCNRPCRNVLMIEQTIEGEHTDILAGIALRLGEVHSQALCTSLCRWSHPPHQQSALCPQAIVTSDTMQAGGNMSVSKPSYSPPFACGWHKS